MKLTAMHGWKGEQDRPHKAPATARSLAGGKVCQALQKALQTQEHVGVTLWCSKVHAWRYFLGFLPGH